MLDREPTKGKNASRSKKPSRSKSKSLTDRQDRRTEDKQSLGVPGIRPLSKQTNRSPLTATENNIQQVIPATKAQADMMYTNQGPTAAFNQRLSSSTPEAKNQRSPQHYNMDQNCPPQAFLHPNSAEPIRKEKLLYVVGGQNGYPSPHISPNANYYPTSQQSGVIAPPSYDEYAATSDHPKFNSYPPSHPETSTGRVRHRSSTFPVDTETFKTLANKHFQTTVGANVARPVSVGPTDNPNLGLHDAFIPRDDYFLHTKAPYQNRHVQFEFEQPTRDTEGQFPPSSPETQNYQTGQPVRDNFGENIPSTSAPFVLVDESQHHNVVQNRDESIQNSSHQDVGMSDLRSESTFVPEEALSDQVPVEAPPGETRRWDPLEVRSRYATIRYLLGELRALAGGDAEFKRIVGELETSINNVSPVKGALNLQAEIDLALQPLRSENCQLRRRLRIVNQQLKERERKEKENIKPDTSFEFAHLHAKYSSLQQKFNEEREKTSQLQNTIYQLEGEVESVKTEKQKMMLTLSEKDTDQMKIRHDWLHETTKLKKELDASNKKIEDLKIKHEASERERHISNVNLQHRDTELGRMTELVHEFKLRYDPSRPQAPLSKRSSPAGQGTSRLTRQALEEFNKTNKAAEKMGSPGLADREVCDTFVHRSPKTSPEQGTDRISPCRPTRFETRPSPQGFEGSTDEKRRSPRLVSPEVNTKSKTVSFVNLQQDDESSVVSSVSEKVSRRSKTPPFVATPGLSETPACTPLIPVPSTPRSESSTYSRYSVTEYFNKYPEGQFQQYSGSFHMESTRQALDMDTSVLSSVTSSFDDGKSVGSESTLTSSSVSSMNSQDDRTFREGLANLDANIARLQHALKKTTVR